MDPLELKVSKGFKDRVEEQDRKGTRDHREFKDFKVQLAGRDLQGPRDPLVRLDPLGILDQQERLVQRDRLVRLDPLERLVQLDRLDPEA
jgi:hypothetical protein